MTDMDAIEYLEELMKYNRAGQMITPANSHFDTFYQCAFEHAIRALKRNAIPVEPDAPVRNNLDTRILTIFKEVDNGCHAVNTPEQENVVIDEIKKIWSE